MLWLHKGFTAHCRLITVSPSVNYSALDCPPKLFQLLFTVVCMWQQELSWSHKSRRNNARQNRFKRLSSTTHEAPEWWISHKKVQKFEKVLLNKNWPVEKVWLSFIHCWLTLRITFLYLHDSLIFVLLSMFTSWVLFCCCVLSLLFSTFCPLHESSTPPNVAIRSSFVSAHQFKFQLTIAHSCFHLASMFPLVSPHLDWISHQHTAALFCLTLPCRICVFLSCFVWIKLSPDKFNLDLNLALVHVKVFQNQNGEFPLSVCLVLFCLEGNMLLKKKAPWSSQWFEKPECKWPKHSDPNTAT